MLRFLIFGCLVFAFGATSHGQVVVSLDASGNNSIDLGDPGANKQLDFYIGRAMGSMSQPITGAVPNYEFLATVSLSNGMVAPSGAASGSGFFGDGNLQFSQFRVDSATMFGINQEFDDPQPLSETPELWFSLTLDTSGLADGTYDINVQDADESFPFFTGATVEFLSVNNNLQFIINSAAIPEPGAASLIGALGLLAALHRRRVGSARIG